MTRAAAPSPWFGLVSRPPPEDVTRPVTNTATVPCRLRAGWESGGEGSLSGHKGRLRVLTRTDIPRYRQHDDGIPRHARITRAV